MITTLAFVLATQARPQPIVTPYAQRGPVQIRDVKLGAERVAQYEMQELTVDLGATYDNPFDPEDVSLDAEVVTPSGKTFRVPGFLDRPYERTLANGFEELKPAGDPRWKIRVTPLEEGVHRLRLTLKDRQGTATRESSFIATKAESPGMVRVSPRDRRFFEFDNGTAFYPIGSNVGWGPRGTFDFETWFGDYGKAGANYARVWLSPSWTTFGMEQPGKPSEGKGLGQIDLANAWRLDYVSELARKNGIYLQLCLESYNVLRSGDAFPWWEKTPHNQDNGGPLRIWSDFWTSPVMERHFRNKMRYLVARYGSMRSTAAWEFWNEVDLTQDFDIPTVQGWHQRMGRALRELDPYDHPVTTSLSNSMGNRELELISELDFFQTHHYGSADLAATVVYQQSRKAWGRPHLVAEIGADASGPRAAEDPKGLQIHDPMWASIGTGVSGTAMPWWWDTYIAPRKLYPLFTAAAKFVQGVDWPGEAFIQTKPSFAMRDSRRGIPRADLRLGGTVSWGNHPTNHPQTVTIRNGKASGANLVSGIQHGTVNRPTLHNPVLFKVHLDRATRFDVEVNEVSGFGGAALRIDLDGSRMLSRDFADPDGQTDTKNLTKYRGRYGFTIPAGYHTVKVSNPGRDWFTATYRFAAAVPRTAPPIDGWGVVGNRTALVWARVQGRDWRRLAVFKDQIPAAPETIMGMAGLAAGRWKMEVWDTWRGVVTKQAIIGVPIRGKVRIPVPKIETDIAIKLTRL